MKNYGLQPTPRDDRDYSLGWVEPLIDLAELPDHYQVSDPYIKNQGSTDHCSAYMSCAMSEPQEGIPLNPAYSFAVSKDISGNVSAWGQNLRDALKAHTKVGALPQKYFTQRQSIDDLRFLANWNLTEANLKEIEKHKKKYYFKVEGQYDFFDNARASIFQYKAVIGTGVQFGWPTKQILLDSIVEGFGHAISVIGFTKFDDGQDVLILQNSYGTTAGLNGLHYITREVYNHYAEKYGHYMFVDMTDEQIESIKPKSLWQLFINWLSSLWRV